MPRLRDTTPVSGSVERTQAELERFLLSLRGGNGVARLRLRVPMDGIFFGISLDRDVRIEAHRTRDAENLNDVIRIAWTPEGTMVFPSFEGTLIVWSEGDPNLSYIELDGSYKPPLGTAGQVFDATIGQSIAHATAREFLKDLKAAIESAP